MISNIANYKALYTNNNQIKACLCCFSDDFEKYHEKIIDDVIRVYSDIDIYYNSCKETTIDDEDKKQYIECLKEFDLFIVPITYSFLVNKSIARDIDLVFALRNKYPVLPIVVEPYIEGVISKRFSGLSVNNKLLNANDSNEYNKKLQEFFNNFFPSPSLVEEIQNLNTSHIYIINNSNDLRYVNKICNKIHVDYGFNNIGIYHSNNTLYYEKASYIDEAKIKNSDVVILLITSNLINLSNRELYDRYNAATEMSKPIIPILVDDEIALNYDDKFTNLPKVIKLKNDDAIKKQIEKYCSDSKLKNSEDKYKKALAYMLSIDTERNISKAIELLKESALDKYMPAVKLLSSIYSSGIYDDYSRNKAIYYKNIELKHSPTNNVENIWASLAELYFRNRDYYYARRYYSKCYKSYKNKYGEKDPKTLSAYHNLGTTYLRTNNIRKAIKVFKSCYESRKEVLSENNISTIESLIMLASAYNKLGEHERSKDVDMKLLDLLSRMYGISDKRTLRSMDRVANDYCNLKDYKTANEYNTKSYEIKKENYGENDVETIASLKNIAKVYSQSGDYKKAIELNEQIYGILVNLFDIYYPQALDTLNDISKDQYRLKNYNESIRIGEDVFEKRKEILGESNPDTLDSLKNLIEIYETAGDHSRAVKLNEQYKQLYTSSFNYKRLFIILAIILLIYIVLPIIVINISSLFR